MRTPISSAAEERARLRVLRICTAFMPPDVVLDGNGRRFDPIGGMQNHTAELTRELDTRGVKQTVVTTRLPGAPLTQRLGSDVEVIRLGLPIRRFRQLYSVPSIQMLPRLAAHANLVHAHLGEDLAVLPLAARAAGRRGIPLVVTVHCSLRHTLRTVDPRSALLKWAGGEIERRTLRSADAIIVLTPRLAQKLAFDGIPAERIYVIPSGVNPRLFSGSLPPPWPALDGPLIVFVGRLVRQKGPRTLLEAARLMGDSNAHFIFVGDGPERAVLERAALDHRLTERVHLTGFVSHDLVPSVLAHADLLVLPSVYEELGSVLLEGMQAGLPIVASNAGGIPDVVVHEDNGLLVPPEDPSALADAIRRILSDPRLARRLSRSARSRADSYDWRVLSAKVLVVYRDIVNRRAPRTARHHHAHAHQP
jgi:glycogen(starch) synthase